MSYTFTFHTPSASLTVGKDAYNALAVDGEGRILIIGSDLSKAEADTLTEAFASEGGTVAFTENAPIGKVRQNVDYTAKKCNRRARFAKVTANTPEAPIVAYVVTLAPLPASAEVAEAAEALAEVAE